MSAEAIASLAEFEREHLNSTLEHALVVNNSGAVLLKKTGRKTWVRFSEKELTRMRGGYFSHNHPSGNSFSPSDIRLLISAELAQIRAFGCNDLGQAYLHVAMPPRDRWKTTPAHAEHLLTVLAEEIKRESARKILRRRLKTWTFESEWWHWVNEEGAKMLGYFYERRRLK